jgi:hypothetical protein
MAARLNQLETKPWQMAVLVLVIITLILNVVEMTF